LCVSQPIEAHSQIHTPEAAAAAIHSAYITGDIDALQKWFADTLTFDGEVRVLVKQAGGQQELRDTTVVLRDEDVLRPGWIAATLTAPALADAYRALLQEIGSERFTEIVSGRPWKVMKIDRSGFPYPAVKAGDYIVVLHLRRDSEPENLDEAVIFVLREVRGEQRVVAHLADY
jgi:hypothetical protein